MGGIVPPAYLPLEDCSSPSEAFRMYIEGMNKWVEFARRGQTATANQGVPPVNLPATPKCAEEISKRLEGLLLSVKSFFEDSD